MTPYESHAVSDLDECFNHRRQNAALDRALDRHVGKQARFGVLRRMVATDERTPFGSPVMVSVVAGVQDYKTGAFVTAEALIGDIACGLLKACRLGE